MKIVQIMYHIRQHANAKASLCIHAVSPEPPLSAYIKNRNRSRLRHYIAERVFNGN